MKLLIKILSSVFFIGYSPFAPGTLASLAAFFAYVLFIRGNLAGHLISVFLLTVLGFWLSGEAEKLFNKKDARQIVIDDFTGMLVGLLFLPYSLKAALVGLVFFRIMDVLKPYPILKIERLPRGWGVMGDDLLAGLYANIALQLLIRLTRLNFS